MAQEQKPATQATGQAVKPATNAPAKEAPLKTKGERFKELAPARTRSILKGLEILGNCSNKSGYEYSDADIEKIFGAIKRKTDEIQKLFTSGAKEKDMTFTL